MLLIRTLLIWLLALAIPAQGVAAATMAFCGAKHHGVFAASAGQDAAASHVHGALEATAPHEHRLADASVPAADDQGVSAKAKVGSADQHKCNVCGACCSTGAPMSAVPTMLAAGAESTAFSAAVATVAPFAAEGPDRPPRNLRV
jgi:uncharacterized protein (UPF0210 family)